MEKQYYKVPAISNSLLSEYENKIFNKTIYGNIQQAYEFGKVVHSLVLEPNALLSVPDSIDFDQAKNVALAIRKNNFAKWLCQWSKKEVEYYWTEKTTGLPCKSLIDGCFKNSLLFDLKTTSAKTENEFRRNVLAFSYNRQGAFYLDATGAKRFIIVGVQKIEPYKVFTVELTKTEIQDGRNKYLMLIKHAQRFGFFNNLLNERNHALSKRNMATDNIIILPNSGGGLLAGGVPSTA